MVKIYKTTFKLLRGTHEEWDRLNPILQEGEPGFETDTFKLKIGNGIDRYVNLPYIGGDGTSGGQGEISVINRPTHYDFPSIGNPNINYKAEKERQIYQWDKENFKYVVLGMSNDISLIYGGNADDNI